MMVDRQYVVAALHAKRLLRDKELEIKCDEVSAIAYRDIIELFLYISRVSRWTWADSQSRREKRSSLVRILLNLIHDTIFWPIIYSSKSAIIAQLQGQANSQGTIKFKGGSVALFLRTDHWFNVESGGSVGHLSGVIHGLRSLGLQTHVISTDHLVGVEQDDCFHVCRPIYRLGRNLPNVPELLYNDQLVRWVDEQWKRWCPSFIYQRYSLGNYTGVLLKQKYGVPYVCEYNGSFPWIARNWERRRLLHEKLLTQIELLNLNTADLIVVVSQPLKDELVARGIEKDKILVNPNGIDPELYSPIVDGSSIRTRHNLNGKVVIGFIGTFGEWHGAEKLAEAFGRLLNDFPEYRDRARLLMIGDGVTMPQVKENLAKYQVENACVLTGLVPQQNGPAHLAACDILASPHVPNPDGTPFFGSPTKLFEYMAVGKGIVASDLNQIGDILEHNYTAWLVKPGDVESLMLGLKTLIDDEELRNRLGQAAREKVVTEYTWKQHTQRILDALQARGRSVDGA